MDTLHTLPSGTRRVMCIVALFTAAAAYAGPREDVQEADEALRIGNLPAAMELFVRAANQDFPLAQARLGDMLRTAEFEEEAVVLYQQAAARGEPAGEVGLGRALADGAGIKQDTVRALELYRKAEARNYGPALDMLARAYRTGTLGLPRDLEKARSYEDKALALSRNTPAAARVQ